jgi:hypothetical protein
VEKENSMLKFINARLYTYNFGAISVAIFPARHTVNFKELF